MLRTKIANIRELIQKEKKYAWMLIFVVLIHSVSILSHPVVLKKQPKQKRFQVQQKLLKENPQMREELLKKALKEKPHLVYIMGVMTMSFLAGIFFGIILLIKFIIYALKKQTIIPKTLESAQIEWGILDVAKVIILFAFIGTVFSLFEAVLLRALNLRQQDERLDMILQTLLGDILGLLFILYFVIVRHKQKIESLGLSVKKFFINVGAGFTGYVAFFPVLAGIFLSVLWVADALKYQPPPEPIMDLFFEETRSRLLVVLTILVSCIGPAIEEVFFRGFLYNAIKKKSRPIFAMLISAALFSALHTNVLGFLPIMALGVLLAYLYEKSGSLIPSITVHVFHNSMLTLLIFSSRTLMGL